MRIGELAAEAGVNVQTIRFYERRGLLREPMRLATGYRVYSSEAVRTIRFIKQSQKLGFTLAEVRDLLRFLESRTGIAAEVRAIAEAKIRDIDEKIECLQGTRDELIRRLASCECGKRHRPCVVFEGGMDEPEPRRTMPAKTSVLSPSPESKREMRRTQR